MALEPPGRTSTASSPLSLNSWPEPHGERHVRWAAGHVPTPGNTTPRALMSGVLTPLQNWLPRPRRSHVLPIVGAGIGPSAKALPCLQPWRAPRPPAGHLPAARNPQGRGQVPAGAGEPGASLWGPRTPGLLPLPGLFRALPQPLTCSGGPGRRPCPLCACCPASVLPHPVPGPPRPLPVDRVAGLILQEAMWVQPGPATGCQPLCPQGSGPTGWGSGPSLSNPTVKTRGPPAPGAPKARALPSSVPGETQGGGQGSPAEARRAWARSSLTALPSSPEHPQDGQDACPLHRWPRGTSASPGPPQGGVVPLPQLQGIHGG